MPPSELTICTISCWCREGAMHAMLRQWAMWALVAPHRSSTQQAGALNPSMAPIGGSYSHLATHLETCWPTQHTHFNHPPILPFPGLLPLPQQCPSPSTRSWLPSPPPREASPRSSLSTPKESASLTPYAPSTRNPWGLQNANILMTISLANPSSSAISTTPPKRNNTPATLRVPPLPASRPLAST